LQQAKWELTTRIREAIFVPRRRIVRRFAGLPSIERKIEAGTDFDIEDAALGPTCDPLAIGTKALVASTVDERWHDPLLVKAPLSRSFLADLTGTRYQRRHHHHGNAFDHCADRRNHDQVSARVADTAADHSARQCAASPRPGAVPPHDREMIGRRPASALLWPAILRLSGRHSTPTVHHRLAWRRAGGRHLCGLTLQQPWRDQDGLLGRRIDVATSGYPRTPVRHLADARRCRPIQLGS
jgi:hypothetical protein